MTQVVISGASIAGPALAYWLGRYGCDVTVIERAPGVRAGGYPIDVRGSAIDIAERMGVLPALREATIHTQRMTVLRGDGRFVGSIEVPEVLGESAGRDVELPRGELIELLYALTEDRVDYLFGGSTAPSPSPPAASRSPSRLDRGGPPGAGVGRAHPVRERSGDGPAG